MRRMHFGAAGCALLALLATPAVVAATPTTAASKQDARVKEVSKLLEAVGTDARAVEAQARQIEKLAGTHAPTYQGYDRRWNEMKPKVEQLTVKLGRLKKIRDSALPGQQQVIDKSALLIGRISADTEKLNKFLNSNADNLSDPMFEKYGQTLAREAHELARLAGTDGGSGNAPGMKKKGS